ncbi:MAG: ferritin family protein [Deltaproteobacteria bacterium]|jgi:rubrerythrin
MEGGIKAWNGMVATGTFEAGMAFFAPATDIREIVAVAWSMEEGSRRFYQRAGELLRSDPETVEIFRQLTEAEDAHKHSLLASYEHLTGRRADPTICIQKMGMAEEGIMEGGIPVKEALVWLQDREITEILDLAMGLEINAYDLYLKMGRRMEAEESGRIFAELAREEQHHLERLGQLLDSRL